MLNKKSVDDINVKGLRVLVRCDFNVPLQDGKITDENRLVAALPTIKKLIADGGKVILCSHLGKPKGEPKPELSLAPVAVRLSELLGQEVKFAADPEVVGANARAAVEAMKDGEVILLENTRYRMEETKNGEAFSKELASLCDVFVDDAFGTAHRAEATTYGIAQYAPVACAGPLLASELDALSRALDNPARPMMAIVGGAKVSGKLEVLKTLADKVDNLIVGGGIANTFLLAAGFPVGKSLIEEELVGEAKAIMSKMQARNASVPLPVDVVCAKEFAASAQATVKKVSDVEPDDMILDIGPETAKSYAELIAKAKTVVWNGPVGVFEFEQFGGGTKAVAQAIADSDAYSLAGGGDTLAAIAKYNIADKIGYISTGGGAFLEFMEGKVLPAVGILMQRAG